MGQGRRFSLQQHSTPLEVVVVGGGSRDQGSRDQGFQGVQDLRAQASGLWLQAVRSSSTLT